MGRLLTWLGLAAGAAYVLSRFRRRPAPVPAPAAGRPADPAEELKQKLAESRADPEPAAQPEPPPEEPNAAIDERRRAVHDRARQAMDDMLGGEQLPGEESE
ncbi:MAG TPA: hypothetical protein VH816_05010 [Gaiellaceae bacterium]|jgi:hypothetical protein